MKTLKSIIIKFFRIIFLVILIFVGFNIVLLVLGFILAYDEISDPCYFRKVFSEKSYDWKYSFETIWRDFTAICSYSLKETDENLKNFKKIDDEYFENQSVEFMFQNLEDPFTEERKYYKEKEIEVLKNIKSDLQNWEKNEEILYYYFIIEEWLSDYEVCYYKKSENKGYCVVVHI